ncbi:MAG: hypothetical protein JWN93_2975 [Hyphomicrobiales bacterium]|nr:hypothetical protein [Hyphomicrobiales bacterium]
MQDDVNHDPREAPQTAARQGSAQPELMNSVLRRNIDAVQRQRSSIEGGAGLQERIADAVTVFAGSMWFVYLHAAIVAGWVAVNRGWTPFPVFDESFVVLATVASVEAIFLSTFILISQNRAAAAADRRADLDLQVSLLAEHEVTRILTICTEIAKAMNLQAARDPRLNELKQDVAPEEVLAEIQRTQGGTERGRAP